MRSRTWGWFLLTLSFAAPALADFGCHFLLDQVSYLNLDDPEKKVSIRFTAREDMDLLGVSFLEGPAKDLVSLKVSVQDDLGGQPSTVTLGSSFLVPGSNGWKNVPFNNLPLLEGHVYHLVFEIDQFRGGHHKVSTADPDHFVSLGYGDTLNGFDPQDEKKDPKLDLLVLEKGHWKTLGRQPLFALYGAGFKAQGAPYDTAGEIPIHGNGTPGDPSDDLLQSECLHPHYGFNATGVRLRVRKVGNPASPLNYRVYIHQYIQHKTFLGFSGHAFQPGEIGRDFQWHSFKFKKEDNPQSFPPECRYVVFQTDAGRPSDQAPGCQDCYVISDLRTSGGLANGDELTFDGGAHLSREAYSTDGGKTWIDLFERDANVILTGPESPSPTLPSTLAVPTPDLLRKALEP
ncbi:MAG TPA: hypothetical protein VHE12_12310 [bacterium]|nr:hypothetical protein [bacterium]